MVDIFANTNAGLESPPQFAVAVVPSDTADLAFASRALWVGTPGVLKVTMVGGGAPVELKAASGWMVLRVKRVWATVSAGTPAADIISVW